MDSKQASQVTTGLVVVAIGLILLAGQFDSDWAIDVGRMWPLVFIAFFFGKVLNKDVGGSVFFLFMGTIFLLHTYRIMSLRDTWPLFIVSAGVSMMFPKERRRRLRHRSSSDEQQTPPTAGDGRFPS